jgi:hypothetical protein
MKSVYRSVIDLKLAYFSVGLFIVLLVMFIFLHGPWFEYLVLLVWAAIQLPSYFYTCYVIDGDVLKIRSGWVYNKKFLITDLLEIRKPESLVRNNSPILSSKDAIGIYYAKYDCVYISPERRPEFIAELQRINPNIKVDDNLPA